MFWSQPTYLTYASVSSLNGFFGLNHQLLVNTTISSDVLRGNAGKCSPIFGEFCSPNDDDDDEQICRAHPKQSSGVLSISRDRDMLATLYCQPQMWTVETGRKLCELSQQGTGHDNSYRVQGLSVLCLPEAESFKAVACS